MALARTTSSSAVSRATLPISLRYIRTGSSMPIMSAEIASSSSADGSSTSFGSSLVGPSAGSLRGRARRRRPSPTTTSTVVVRASSATGQVEIVVVRHRLRLLRPRRAVLRDRAQAGELGLFEVRLGATGSRQDGLDELLVEGIGGHGYLRWPVLWRGRRWRTRQESGLFAAPIERSTRLVDGCFVRAGAGRWPRGRRHVRPRPGRLRCTRSARAAGRPRAR